MEDLCRKQKDELKITHEVATLPRTGFTFKIEYLKIEKAFKNPEFRKMFGEYCQELQDPKVRELYEAELTALEAERGNNIRFVKPIPQLVLKTRFTRDPPDSFVFAFAKVNTKVFINICTSTEIQPATERSDSKGRGQNWSIPYSLAAPKEDCCRDNTRCVVFDAVFHPVTMEIGQNNPRFQKMLMGTAVEGIQRQFDVLLGSEATWTFPKMKSKGVPTQTIIRGAAPISDPINEKDTFFHELQNSSKPLPAPALSKHRSVVHNERPPNSASTSTSDDSATAQVLDTLASQGIETPSYTLVHRGAIDYSHFTSQKVRDLPTRPEYLVLKVELPRMETVQEAELDVTARQVTLSVPSKYRLSVDLSFEVDQDNGSAKFIKKTRCLELVLPVMKPEHPLQASTSAMDPHTDRPPSPQHHSMTELNSSAQPGHDARSNFSVGTPADPPTSTVKDTGSIDAEREPNGAIHCEITQDRPEATPAADHACSSPNQTVQECTRECQACANPDTCEPGQRISTTDKLLTRESIVAGTETPNSDWDVLDCETITASQQEMAVTGSARRPANFRLEQDPERFRLIVSPLSVIQEADVVQRVRLHDSDPAHLGHRADFRQVSRSCHPRRLVRPDPWPEPSYSHRQKRGPRNVGPCHFGGCGWHQQSLPFRHRDNHGQVSRDRVQEMCIRQGPGWSRG
ncbi:pre-RNA processing PIH1/Nop17-domain-containing protein [Polychytrium aggregatum]|uniref:pre-RNA processing PIH1/Nop17-domain-containing protein n=1 Tax=Polychytrium aggregatum TaxID=110093 RepID=UPI0022FE926F|nr:pre-RNA processing PIH1/Nop17-domain-containing protein [Polychytrium aggregatum]KAI9207863.1 pre-RNA processing PIH1/Nop17-domain-containing protein [Polychytrium aggregatum]